MSSIRQSEPAPGRHRTSASIAVVIGFLGSLSVVFGSFSIGWLPVISPINKLPLVVALRTSDDAVVMGTVLLTVGCWLMMWGWLRLGIVLREPEDARLKYRFIPGGLRWTNLATAVWGLPLLFALPIFSRDMFAYVNQGRLVVQGLDPYQGHISELSNWFQLGSDPLWAQDSTPYGPLYLWISAGVVKLTGADNSEVVLNSSANSIDVSLFLFRMVAVLGVILVMWVVPRLATEFGTQPGRTQWIVPANPLFLISFIASGHNDALMIGLALAAILAVRRGHGMWAIILIVASVGIKPISLVLLPFIGLWWAGPAASWGRKFLYWSISAVTALVLLMIIGALDGTWFGWLTVMVGTGNIWSWWAPVTIIGFATSGVLQYFGTDIETVLEIAKPLGRALSVLIVLLLMFIGKYRTIFPRMMWAFTAIVVLSPVIHPWYLLWLLPLFAIWGIRGNWQLKLVIFTVAFFTAYGAADQLFTYPFITFEPAYISWVVSAICALWVFLVDPWTSPIITSDWHLRDSIKALRARRHRPAVKERS